MKEIKEIIFNDSEFKNSLKEYINSEIKTELSLQLKLNKEDKYLTINQVCDYLEITPPTLWKWSNIGYLKKLYIVGQPRYLKSDIDNSMLEYLPNNKNI